METEKINLVMRVDAINSLLAIPHGKTVFCPNDDINSATVRSLTMRTARQGKALFKVETVQGGVNITRK